MSNDIVRTLLNQEYEFGKRFKEYNDRIGNALTILGEQPQRIQGRDKEIAMLYAVLERPRTPVALLLGQAGVGKTALVEEFARQLNSGEYETSLNYRYVMFALRIGNLASIGMERLRAELAKILDTLTKFERKAQQTLNDPNIRFVLFIDEVHMLVTIFGPGTKIGGDVIKDVLARSPIRVIAATTRREYDSTIAVDKPLAERFKQIEMHELSPEIVERIAINWWEKIAPDCEQPDLSTLHAMIEANALYRSDSAEPRKSIDILEDLVSYSRRTGKKATIEQLSEIFKNRYSINLMFTVNPDEVYGEIERRVKGQPFALYSLKRLLRSMVFQLDMVSNRPMMTALFTGPTGVGKTETVKAIAHTLYPGENVMLNINMPDYKTPEHEAAFRKRLGEHIRHVPNSIILLDEFEKAHETIRDALLVILDEGMISFETINREGLPEVNTVSLRNSIVIATTNAGHEVFANDAKFSQREDRGESSAESIGSDSQSKSEVEQLYKNLITFLQSAGFKPEMLGRFDRIIPYRSLSSQTLLKIAENELENLRQKLFELREIEVVYNNPRQWPEDVYDFFTTDVALYISFIRAKADDPNSGGARAIKREVKSSVYDEIIDAIIDNPGVKKFKVYIDEESPIYVAGAAAAEGAVHVVPLIEEG